MFQELVRLFANPLRVKVLKFFALQTEARFKLPQVASALGTSRDAVLSELKALNRIKIITSRPERGGRTYAWNQDYVGALAIQNFVIEATTPADDVIVKAFRPMSPSLIVAAGALADETRGSVDLLVVTRRPKDPRLQKAIKKLESVTAVPVRYAVMDVGEYMSRREGYDRLLRDIFDFGHRVVVGQA